MDQNRFDDLSRCVAVGVSRRQMLKMIIGSVSGLFASQLVGCKPTVTTTPTSTVTPTPSVTLTPTPTPTAIPTPECLSECQKCVDAGQENFYKEFSACQLQYPDQNDPAYKTCLETASQKTLVSFDTCITPLITNESSSSENPSVIRTTNGRKSLRSSIHKSDGFISSAAFVTSCDDNAFGNCRDRIAYTATVALGTCAITDCLVAPPNCYRCAAKVMTAYFAALKFCFQQYSCGRGEKCVEGKCAQLCDPPLQTIVGPINTVCCDPCMGNSVNPITLQISCGVPLCDKCNCDPVSGKCNEIPVAKPCGDVCCGDCQVCDKGKCRSCNGCERCENGTCVSNVSSCQTCENGQIRNCNACETCDTNGICVPITGAQLCGNACCGSNQVCVNGTCKNCPDPRYRCYTNVNGICVRRADTPVMCVDTIGTTPTWCYSADQQCCGTRGGICHAEAKCCPLPDGNLGACCSRDSSCCLKTVNGVTRMTCCAPNQSCDCD